MSQSAGGGTSRGGRALILRGRAGWEWEEGTQESPPGVGQVVVSHFVPDA